VGGGLNAPLHLINDVHLHYFEPAYPDFRPRTMWSLANAFTLAIKTLAPMKHFQAAAEVHGFLGRYDE